MKVGRRTPTPRCSVCRTQHSSAWVRLGSRLYCAEHVPSRKTLRRRVRELRGRGAEGTLGKTPSADVVLPKADIPAGATLRCELVLCGKRGCKALHGPYWYAYWQERSGLARRTRKRYIGKHLPADVARRALAPRRRKWWRRADDARVVEELELGGDDE